MGDVVNFAKKTATSVANGVGQVVTAPIRATGDIFSGRNVVDSLGTGFVRTTSGITAAVDPLGGIVGKAVLNSPLKSIPVLGNWANAQNFMGDTVANGGQFSAGSARIAGRDAAVVGATVATAFLGAGVAGGYSTAGGVSALGEGSGAGIGETFAATEGGSALAGTAAATGGGLTLGDIATYGSGALIAQKLLTGQPVTIGDLTGAPGPGSNISIPGTGGGSGAGGGGIPAQTPGGLTVIAPGLNTPSATNLTPSGAVASSSSLPFLAICGLGAYFYLRKKH